MFGESIINLFQNGDEDDLYSFRCFRIDNLIFCYSHFFSFCFISWQAIFPIYTLYIFFCWFELYDLFCPISEFTFVMKWNERLANQRQHAFSYVQIYILFFGMNLFQSNTIELAIWMFKWSMFDHLLQYLLCKDCNIICICKAPVTSTQFNSFMNWSTIFDGNNPPNHSSIKVEWRPYLTQTHIKTIHFPP